MPRNKGTMGKIAMKRKEIEIENDVWQSFKTLAAVQGLKIKQATRQAILEYIKNHEVSQVKIDVQVIQNKHRNLLTFIYEEEIKNLLSSMIQAKRRNAPDSFIKDLKKQTLTLLKKNPAISEDLANEVLTVFKNLT